MKLIAYEHTAHVHHHAAHHSHIHLHGLKLSHSWFLVSVVHVFTTLCGVLYARCVGLSRVICKFAETVFLCNASSKMLRIAHLNHIVAAIFGLHQIGNGIAVKKFIDHAV